jgi:hypothetical protein
MVFCCVGKSTSPKVTTKIQFPAQQMKSKLSSKRFCAHTFELSAACTSQQTWKPISANIHRHFHVVKHLWCIASINCFHLLAFIKTWNRFYFYQNNFFLRRARWEGRTLLFSWSYANFLCTRKSFERLWFSCFLAGISFHFWTRSLHDSKSNEI